MTHIGQCTLLPEFAKSFCLSLPISNQVSSEGYQKGRLGSWGGGTAVREKMSLNGCGLNGRRQPTGWGTAVTSKGVCFLGGAAVPALGEVTLLYVSGLNHGALLVYI